MPEQNEIATAENDNNFSYFLGEQRFSETCWPELAMLAGAGVVGLAVYVGVDRVTLPGQLEYEQRVAEINETLEDAQHIEAAKAHLQAAEVGGLTISAVDEAESWSEQELNAQLAVPLATSYKPETQPKAELAGIAAFLYLSLFIVAGSRFVRNAQQRSKAFRQSVDEAINSIYSSSNEV